MKKNFLISVLVCIALIMAGCTNKDTKKDSESIELNAKILAINAKVTAVEINIADQILLKDLKLNLAESTYYKDNPEGIPVRVSVKIDKTGDSLFPYFVGIYFKDRLVYWKFTSLDDASQLIASIRKAKGS